jgi:Ca2+-dependent lipid-binding protein
MYDKDVAADDKMGKLVIQLSHLPPGQIIDQWYEMKPTKSCKKPGQIHLGLQVVIRGVPPWTIAPFVPLQAQITLIEAKDLAKMDTLGKSDPFCKVTLKGTSFQWTSKVKDNTLTPVWNETLTFPLTNPYTDVVHIVVKDKDVASDDDMASLDLPLAAYGNGQRFDGWLNLSPAKGVKKGGEIHLVITLTPAPQVTYAPTQTGVIAELPKAKK